jgi:subtilisin family serine protease
MNYKSIFITIVLLLGTVIVVVAQTKILNGNIYKKIDYQWHRFCDEQQYRVSSDFVTVKFLKGLSESQKVSVAKMNECTIADFNSLEFYLLKLDEGKDAIETVESLIDDNNIEMAEPNTYGEFVEHANDTFYGDQWHLNDEKITGGIDAFKAWEKNNGNPDVVIAVLDSGTDIEHEDLKKNIWVNPGEDIDGDGEVWDSDDMNGIDDDGNGKVDDLSGWDFGDNDNTVSGSHYHGTHVAGIIGAGTNDQQGVAGVSGGWTITDKGAALLICNVGGQGSMFDWNLSEAIFYAIDNGVDIITMSLHLAPSPWVEQAINQAYEKGIFIDNASGNGGYVGPGIPFPASLDNCFAVGSIEPMVDKKIWRAEFSCYGNGLMVVGPGVDIKSTRKNNSYGAASGTSYASPQVAATAGLILSQHPDFTAEDVKKVICLTAMKDFHHDEDNEENIYTFTYGFEYGSWNSEVGYGKLNANRALGIIDDIQVNTTLDEGNYIRDEIHVNNSSTLTIQRNSRFYLLKTGKLVIVPGATVVVEPEVIIKGETSSNKIIVEGTLRLNSLQLKNINIEIKDGGELIILDELTFDNTADLILHPGSVVSGQVGVSNTLTINGDLNALNGVTFTNLSSTTSDGVVIDNDNAINIATCQFNSSNLTGHVSLNDGVSISETNFDGSYVRLDIFTSTTSGLCEITDNTFENILGSAAQPIPALRIEDFPMFTISGNTFTNNISDGIAVYNSGNISIPGHSISNNQINNQSGKGIIIYASVVDIYDNQINDNKYGVATYHNSNVKLSGSVASAKRGIYQTINSNERNQVLAGSQSFPWHFTYNVIQETNSTYPRVYSTDGAPQNPYDIERNCWGDNFTPATDLSPLSYYDYSPVWDCGLTLLSNPLPLAPRMAYETSLTSIEQENYTEAETQLKTIVTNWPESSFAGEALKTLQSVAAKTNTLDELVTYYNTNETILASEELAKLAGYLVADTRIIQKEFPDALSHYEEIIGNPPTQEDYIYASIDAGRVQYLMEKEGGKSAVNFKYANLIPPTKQEYKKNRRILLDEIKGDPIPESFEKQTDSDFLSLNSNLKIYPNPVLDIATIELNVGIQTNVIIEIIDISGKLIKQVNCQTTSTGKLKHAISTKGMNNGVYFIKALFNNGQSMSKIVVAK